MSGLDRAIAFSRAFDERRAEQLVPTTHGKVILTPSLPLVRHRNHLSVDLGARATAEELIAEAEPVFADAGLRHLKITIDDELGATVAPRFRELGWEVEELLVMLYRGDAIEVDTSIAEEVEPAELEPLWARGMRGEGVQDDEEIRQLIAAQLGRRAGAEVRYFGARAESEIASYCELFLADGVGQIESVMTLAEFRNRGLAKAVVARARDESLAAGSELTFIVADANDWPKELYERLGFVTAGRMWDLVRKPPTPAT